MAFEEGVSLFMKIMLVIVIIAVVVGLAFTFEYDQPSKHADFNKYCFDWYKDGCDINAVPAELYDSASTEPGLCEQLYPGTNSLAICQEICNNECIASGIGGE